MGAAFSLPGIFPSPYRIKCLDRVCVVTRMKASIDLPSLQLLRCATRIRVSKDSTGKPAHKDHPGNS